MRADSDQALYGSSKRGAAAPWASKFPGLSVRAHVRLGVAPKLLRRIMPAYTQPGAIVPCACLCLSHIASQR